MRVGDYFHTIRFLRPIQIVGRAWRGVYRPRCELYPAPPLRGVGASWSPGCEKESSMVAPDTFRMLNQTARIEGPRGWDDPARSRLWRYNLHYFDFLQSESPNLPPGSHEATIARWIAENPPARGTGWEPYPTSLRIVNWIKWALAGETTASSRLNATMLDSLAVQARWLSRNIELHLLGNHLMANAKALVFAGAFFRGDEADRWLRRGVAILERELVEQVLADGGHFERSPMYHAIFLEDVLDLINLSNTADCFAQGVETRLTDTAVRMLRWQRVMTHPDGGIAFFNDAAFGIAPEYGALAAYSARLGLPPAGPLDSLEALSASGYFRLEQGDAVLFCDAACLGPDYLPGHAHADTLSFELSVGGARAFVNGGTSTYDAGPARDLQRGTAAHNTVEIDGENSSEVWAGFRVARRARPLAVTWAAQDDGLVLGASHDGYRRLPGRVTHRRHWKLERNRLTIVDLIEGRARAARAALHLHPQVKIARVGEDGQDSLLLLPGGKTARLGFTPRAVVSREADYWHPEFGLEVPSQTIRVTLRDNQLQTSISW